MAERAAPYGLLAAFDDPAALARAIRRLRAEGYRHLDGFGPIPSEEVTEALGARDGRVPVIALACGALGAGAAYFLQYHSAVEAYPFVVGGRPLHAWPAFLVITIVVALLTSAVGVVVGMLALNRLPRPHHPLFDAAIFERAGSDRFLLCIRAEDPRFDPERTEALLRELEPESVVEVAR